MSVQTNSDRLFKFILKCQKNSNTSDLHSFWINITGGKAFVDCKCGEVYVQTYYNDGNSVGWCGTAVAAANRLEKLGADYAAIDM